MINLSIRDINRFHTFFWPDAKEKCWPWLGSIDTSGYGLFRFNGALQKSHRVAYFIENGKYDFALYVCHDCDNTICVNPNHLFLGTPKDNSQDRQNKGRTVLPRPMILTKEDIVNARYMYKEGNYTYQQLANIYGVSLFCMHSNLNKEI